MNGIGVVDIVRNWRVDLRVGGWRVEASRDAASLLAGRVAVLSREPFGYQFTWRHIEVNLWQLAKVRNSG